MKLFLNILIAAVTVNCLVTTINGKAAIDTLAVPYIDMLLPPLEDSHNKDTASKINAPTKATTVRAITKATTTTTKKPKSNYENNVLPELSLEALLPPLIEAKLDKERTKASTKAATYSTTTTTTTTTTRRPTTTTRKTTPKTTKYTTTTVKPSYATTTTLKPSILKVPDLSLDPFLPPLFGNAIGIDKSTKVTLVTTTTQKPTTTTNKPYYQQQQLKHAPVNTAANIAKNYNKPTANDRDVAATQTQIKQVTLTTQQQNLKLQSKVETSTRQYVAKQKASSSQNNKKHLNYSYDVYLGSTTPRPAKNGLPTITPFPHRLGR